MKVVFYFIEYQLTMIECETDIWTSTNSFISDDLGRSFRFAAGSSSLTRSPRQQQQQQQGLHQRHQDFAHFPHPSSSLLLTLMRRIPHLEEWKTSIERNLPII